VPFTAINSDSVGVALIKAKSLCPVIEGGQPKELKQKKRAGYLFAFWIMLEEKGIRLFFLLITSILYLSTYDKAMLLYPTFVIYT